MTAFEIAFVTAYLASAVTGLAFVAYTLRTAVRPRPHDPEAVDRLIAKVRSPRAIAMPSFNDRWDERDHQDRHTGKRPATEAAGAENDAGRTPQEFDLEAAAVALDDVCRQFNVELLGTPSGVRILPKQRE
ncbi:hypothetical protein RM543_10415 [Roseicyclus sp. F158]|uniref:Uncharacterized protein n=1 Tax=Tropicimonas omnivorans TaxID=3075590 RepID=A0ABU3DHD2_9RHOB|nr:hypothetical protein [Roseicyclus sp. F158]MDT0683100.1 hypothetical protein [Roseicyclus sp. F158]